MGITPEMVRIARGTAWSAVGIVATQALGVVAAILAARALPPAAFGVVGMALVVTALLGAFRDLGLGPAIASGRVTDERTQADLKSYRDHVQDTRNAIDSRRDFVLKALQTR